MKNNLENKILELLKSNEKYTLFLIRQEFKPRYHNDVRTSIKNLLESDRIFFDENQFLKVKEKND